MNNFSSCNGLSRIQTNCFEKIRKLKFGKALGYALKELIAYYNIIKLLIWTNDRRIQVLFYPNIKDCYMSKERKIMINSNVSFEDQFFTLIHECGHHLIYESYVKDPISYHQRFAIGYYSMLNEGTKNTFGKKISIIAEEIEAWVRGFNLTKRLNLRINQENYENYKNKYLKSYVNWASTNKRGK